MKSVFYFSGASQRLGSGKERKVRIAQSSQDLILQRPGALLKIFLIPPLLNIFYFVLFNNSLNTT